MYQVQCSNSAVAALDWRQCALDLLKSGNGGGADTPGLMNDFHDGAVRFPFLRSPAISPSHFE